MYTFRIYYRVYASKRRRIRKIRIDADTLGHAWIRAVDMSKVITGDDEILDSIQIIEGEKR